MSAARYEGHFFCVFADISCGGHIFAFLWTYIAADVYFLHFFADISCADIFLRTYFVLFIYSPYTVHVHMNTLQFIKK